jgi:glucan phosphoethanolaminetransferase (alkaline phosphatase superfamily)
MVEEIDALERTDTWDQLGILFLILLLLFRSRASGSTRFALIALWSAIKCLVACSFQQEYGRDYEETFALVAHRTTIHTLTVSFMRSTCTHLLATLFLMVMFVILYSLKQASRTRLSFLLVLLLVSMILLFSFTFHPEVGLLFFSVDDMLITRDDFKYIDFVKTVSMSSFTYSTWSF